MQFQWKLKLFTVHEIFIFRPILIHKGLCMSKSNSFGLVKRSNPNLCVNLKKQMVNISIRNSNSYYKYKKSREINLKMFLCVLYHTSTRSRIMYKNWLMSRYWLIVHDSALRPKSCRKQYHGTVWFADVWPADDISKDIVAIT